MEIPKYSDIYDFENLYQAASETISDKEYYPEELRFTNKLEENLIEIQNELIWHTYTPGKGLEFKVLDPKERIIYAPGLKDRVVHTAVCRVIEPYINPRLDFDSYACRSGKGSLKAASRASLFANRYSNFLYCDIAKFFDNVPILPLENVFHKRFISDEEIMWLLHTIFMHDCPGVGIKKGCRTSQLSANVYLNELDHFIRHNLKPKGYVRYMDDFMLFSNDVDHLNSCWSEIGNFLKAFLFLRLNQKSYVGATAHGFEYVGYKIMPKYKVVRKLALNRAAKSLKEWKSGGIDNEKFYRAAASRVGHCEGTSSYKWFCDYLLKALKFALIDRPAK